MQDKVGLDQLRYQCQVWGNGPRSPTQLYAPNSAAMLFQEALPVVAKALASKAPSIVELETAADTKGEISEMSQVAAANFTHVILCHLSRSNLS